MKLGVCYYPEHWPEDFWHKDAQRMRAMGLSIVRVGEFAWSRLESTRDDFQFDWLHRALDVLHQHELQVVLGTPTATPPKWLIDEHPSILAIDEAGQPRGFGSRRHYCFSSTIYREECTRIVTRVAQEFGNHPSLIAWQTDNEYGCHSTIASYSNDAKLQFRQWCKQRYGNIESLNTAWGNVFWSMEYQSFDEIDLPCQAVTELNPAHRLAFWRFSSDQVASFNRLQSDILRQHSPQCNLLHNYMGNFTEFDHYTTAADLDIASWDNYPLGFLDRDSASMQEKQQWYRTGHPDSSSFHHDLYRGVGNGRLWIIEQQPGPVNWAPHNPAPLDGMVRLWGLEALAHEAEVMSWFRFRQMPSAQEQMHTGLLRPDSSEDTAVAEIRQLTQDMQIVEQHLSADTKRQCSVAMVFDYSGDHMCRIQPQGSNFEPLQWYMSIYTALRQCGVNVDIVPPDANLSAYKLVVLANSISVSQSLTQALQAT
ncbi:MAG: beta-galactosidase, partial [Pseudomonadota bacterium]